MPRRRRIAFEGACYHIFNRASARKTCCFTQSQFNFFKYLLGKLSDLYNIKIYAYCMMKNHYHLYVCTPEGNISKAMQYFGLHFTKAINNELNSDGPIFRSRYRDVLVESDRHSLTLCRYIHLNPVKAGLVKSPEQYEWSSYNDYLQATQAPHFLEVRPILSHFKKPEEFQEYTNLGIDQETLTFYSKKNIETIYGTEDFKKRFR